MHGLFRLSVRLVPEVRRLHTSGYGKKASVVLLGVELFERPQHPSSCISFGSRTRQLDRVMS